jgi:uncharacterized glyoxalase superfamily protein PhnB
MPELSSLIPYIEVYDMVASVAFYRATLGFGILFASPEVETREGRFSHFVRISQGRAEIMLNTAYDANERPPTRDEARWAGCRYTQFYIDCDDVVALHAEVVGRGCEAVPPAPTAYGYLAFTVADPDGHLLIFQRPI